MVPFGGGKRVDGRVEPLPHGFSGAVTLDLRRLDRNSDIDTLSLTATLAAGLYRHEAERLRPRSEERRVGTE